MSKIRSVIKSSSWLALAFLAGVATLNADDQPTGSPLEEARALIEGSIPANQAEIRQAINDRNRSEAMILIGFNDVMMATATALLDAANGIDNDGAQAVALASLAMTFSQEAAQELDLVGQAEQIPADAPIAPPVE